MASGSAVQRAADPDHRRDRVRVEREARAHRGGPVGEQPYRRTSGRSRRRRPRAAARSEATGQQRLAGDAERLTAGGQDTDARRGAPAAGRPAWPTASIRCSQLSRTRSQPLAGQGVGEPVQRPDQLPGLQRCGSSRGMPIATSTACGTSSAPRDGRQRYEPDAVRHRAGHAARGLGGEPGLAGAARTGERDEPCRASSSPTRSSSSSRPTKLVSCAGRFVLPLRGALQGPPARRAGSTGAPRPARARGRRRGCRRACGGRARTRSSASACRPAAYSARMSWPRSRSRSGWSGGELLEFGYEPGRVAERDVGLDPLLDRLDAQSFQPGDRGGGEARGGDLGERRAAPQAERASQCLGTGRGLALGPRAGHQPFERHRVHLARVHGEPVAARPGLDRVVPAHASQPGDQGLERVARARRRRVPPQVVDQPFGRDRTARVHGQPDQQGAQPVTAHLDGSSRPVPHVQGTQNADVHAAIVATIGFRRSPPVSASRCGRRPRVAEPAFGEGGVIDPAVSLYPIGVYRAG